MIRFALLFLAACQADAGYGLRYPPELRGGVDAMNTGVDCLVAQVEAQGLLTPGAARRMLRDAHIEVRTYQDAIKCAEDAPEWCQLSGMHHPDGVVWFMWSPGVALPDTSFQHELTHALLCAAQRVGPSCWGDTGHDARAWWLPVVPPAQQCWRDALAAQENSDP